MKQTALFFAFFLSLSFANAQNTVLGLCDREPTFHYGEMWIDNYCKHCHGLGNYTYTLWYTFPYRTQSILARYCETDSAMLVIGVAAPVYISTLGNIADPSMENRLPEYFHLYESTDSGIVLMAVAQWDTMTPRYDMEFIRLHYGNLADTFHLYFPVYEAYFDKPVVVTDSFYVGGTTNNNAPDINMPTYDAHPSTYYLRYKYEYSGSMDQGAGAVYPNSAHRLDLIMNDNFPTWNTNPTLDPGFGALFPIFDTSSWVIIGDSATCPSPTGLTVLDCNTMSVSLSWTYQSGNAWELSLARDSMPADSGDISLWNLNFANITGLDSGQTYTAYVRTVCDGNMRSEWSDSVQFTMADPGGPTGTGSPAYRYTDVMPNPAHDWLTICSSFKIKQVELFSANGTPLRKHSADAPCVNLNIADIPAGMLLVRITTNAGVVTKRVVKQ